MSKREIKPLTWKVKNYCCNTDRIWDYDVLKYREDQIKKLKKKCATREEFAEAIRREMMWQYWSRCEYEVIIEIDDDNRINLTDIIATIEFSKTVKKPNRCPCKFNAFGIMSPRCVLAHVVGLEPTSVSFEDSPSILEQYASILINSCRR